MIFLKVMGYGLLVIVPFAAVFWAAVFWSEISNGAWWGFFAALLTGLIIAAAELQVASWLGLVELS